VDLAVLVCAPSLRPNGLFACRKRDAYSGNLFQDQAGWLADEDEMPVLCGDGFAQGRWLNRAEFPLKFNSLEFSGFTRQAGLTVAELTDYYYGSGKRAG
jgi:hypothetical protein